ncbi:PREDICTED: putative helicase mov-10-B.1, partial [Dufourea novaeangliae]
IGDKVKLQTVGGYYSYYAKIVYIERKQVYVTIKNPKFAEQFSELTRVNIKFIASNWPFKCCHYVLHIISKHNLINLLYPAISAKYNSSLGDDFDWVQESVARNPEQKQAVINIVNRTAYPAPYILFGPPGTGKTTTLVEAICQIRKKHKSKHILVCASSNAAADEIAKRLLALIPNKDVFRMYAPSQHWKNIDDTIVSCSNFIDDIIIFLPKDLLILKKIVIATHVTCSRMIKLNLRSDHFSYIFIDEASQSLELESMIPITLASTTNNNGQGILNAQIILAGDPHQLGPVVRCKKIEHLLGKSMLERLMECKPYQKIKNEYNPCYITKLLRNYRSREPILHVPNKLFYDDELICGYETNENFLISNCKRISNKKFPILFIAINGKEEKALSKSVYNVQEIAIVSNYVSRLMRSKFGTRNVREEDIGIITPFRQQKISIERKLSKQGLNKITVGTVETFQGQEREIIIFSTVRSKVFKSDGEHHIGFLSNPKRFNVALTRAKNYLIVVGNPMVLCENEYWKTLWDYCYKNNACRNY